MAKNTTEAPSTLPAIKRKVSAPGSRRAKKDRGPQVHDFAKGPAIGTITRKAKMVETRFGDRLALHLDTCIVLMPARYFDSANDELTVGESIMVTQITGETSFDTTYEIGVL